MFSLAKSLSIGLIWCVEKGRKLQESLPISFSSNLFDSKVFLNLSIENLKQMMAYDLKKIVNFMISSQNSITKLNSLEAQSFYYCYGWIMPKSSTQLNHLREFSVLFHSTNWMPFQSILQSTPQHSHSPIPFHWSNLPEKDGFDKLSTVKTEKITCFNRFF